MNKIDFNIALKNIVGKMPTEENYTKDHSTFDIAFEIEMIF